MSKSVKVWLVIGVILTVTGLAMFLVALSGAHFDFSLLGMDKYVTNTYEITDPFDNLSIETDTADITVLLSQDGSCKVECYEEQMAKHAVAVNEETLSIRVENEKTWYDYIGFCFETPQITLHLPEEKYVALFIEASTSNIEIPKELSFDSVDVSTDTGDVAISASTTGVTKITAGTGDINVEGVSAGALELSVSTGMITAKDVACNGNFTIRVSTGRMNLTAVTCKNLVSTGDTGDTMLDRVIVEEKLSIERNTGDVRFENSDAAEMYVKTDTGDVSGSLLTAKMFITSTDTGSVRVPASTAGGRCEIITDTGDIQITIP